jgi:hypothetical protein
VELFVATDMIFYEMRNKFQMNNEGKKNNQPNIYSQSLMIFLEKIKN